MIRGRWCNMLVLAWVACMNSVYGAEDDYLKSLEAEAAKIDKGALLLEEQAQEKNAGQNSVHQPGVTPDEAHMAKKRAFEALLRSHKGTYSVYQSLIEKDREEVFRAFEQGKSLSDVRQMIVDRKMHR